MKRVVFICTLVCLSCVPTLVTRGQTPGAAATPAGVPTDPAITQTRVFGEVTAIDAAARQITVRTKAGNVVAVELDEQTTYQRMPAGETSPEKATGIALADIALGDQVYARGRVSEDRRSVPAKTVVVVSGADIAQKQARERAEWEQRGIAGTIAALNPATKEITVQTRLREGGSARLVVEAAGGRVQFLRYAPDSVKFSDAKPSSFDELKAGDQIRALGARSADGTRFVPEKVMSGSFRTVGGVVTAVNPQTNEIKINDLQTRQPVTINVGQDSLLRRLSPEVGALFTRMMKASAAPAGGQPPQQQSQGAAGAEGGDAVEESLRRMPVINLGELKPGAMVLVSSTVGADPARVKAIILISGVEPLFTSPQGPRSIPNLASMSMGLP